jgi:hypothetical protein
MRKILGFGSVIIAVAMLASAPAQAPSTATRSWTTTEGKVFQAALVKVDGSQVTLRLTNGQLAAIAVTRLSAGDQAFLKPGAGAPGPATNPGGAGPTTATASVRTPIDKRIWPKVVEVDSRSVEVKTVSEQPEEQRCVYRSQNFEFTSQDKLAPSVIKEVARTFEATHSLVEALPWGIEPKPPEDRGGFYRAKLYTTRENYIADGGPENSGGVYMSRDRVFRVPFESLGLELRGKTWFKKPNYTGETIIHEITHQMMHEFLPFLPIWTAEGTAEYAEIMPYNAGRFTPSAAERGLKDYIKKAERYRISVADLPLGLDLMRMPHEQWMASAQKNPTAQHRLYFASLMTVYYFSHLDGDGKGTRFLKYLDKIAEARDAWQAFFKDPRVELLPDGTFRYRSDLSLPPQKRSEEYGLSQIDVLLDGRDAAQLHKDMIDGFKKLGIQGLR